MTRIAYLGPRGTNSETAALAYDPAAELLPVPTVAAAAGAVAAGEAGAAVCAIENSLEGGVADTLDVLLRDDLSLAICGEVVLPISHALVGAPGIDPAAATVAYSHPQALAQCRRRLAEIAPAASPAAALSTSAAIESAVAEPGTVAIGNARAAKIYGATVYADDIGDESGNETRFIVLAAEDCERTGDDKTSIAFTTHHDRPGSLVTVLRQLSERDINMTRIESRPTRRQLGTYVFLIDFHGHRTDTAVRDALREVEEATLWLRVLGSYACWTEPRV